MQQPTQYKTERKELKSRYLIEYTRDTTRFENNLHHVRSKSKDCRAKDLKMFVIKKTKGQKLSMCTMKCFCVKNQRMSF